MRKETHYYLLYKKNCIKFYNNIEILRKSDKSFLDMFKEETKITIETNESS